MTEKNPKKQSFHHSPQCVYMNSVCLSCYPRSCYPRTLHSTPSLKLEKANLSVFYAKHSVSLDCFADRTKKTHVIVCKNKTTPNLFQIHI